MERLVGFMDQFFILSRKPKLLPLRLDVFDDLIDIELSNFEWPCIDLNNFSWIRCLSDRHSCSLFFFFFHPLVIIVMVIAFTFLNTLFLVVECLFFLGEFVPYSGFCSTPITLKFHCSIFFFLLIAFLHTFIDNRGFH